MSEREGPPDNTPTRTREELAAWLSGDEESADAVFKRHRVALLARAERASWMGGLRQWIGPEDLVGEVFLRALSSGLFARFKTRGGGSLFHALAKILDAVAVDTYRRHGARKRGNGALPESYDGTMEDAPTRAPRRAIAADGTTPTSRAREHEVVEICRAVLVQREWEVWHRMEVLGMDSNEVALELAITPAAARGLRLRARHKVLVEVDRRMDGQPG